MQDQRISELVRHQDPVSLGPDATVQQACALMRERRVGCVLVRDGEGRLVGILTGRDIVHRLGAGSTDLAQMRLAEVMTPDPSCLPPGAGGLDALRLMEDGGFRHVPVVEDGRVLGVVSRGDFRAKEHRQLDQEKRLWERIW